MRNCFKSRISVKQAQKSTPSARWLTFQAGAKYVGVSERTLENWEKLGCFKVARVIAPGKTKGRALIDRESLDDYITQFIGNPPAEIAMNANRGGAR